MPPATRRLTSGSTWPTCAARSRRIRCDLHSSSPSRESDTALRDDVRADMERSPARWARWTGWFLLVAAVTAGMVLVRGRLDKVHVALLYMLLVLGASSH